VPIIVTKRRATRFDKVNENVAVPKRKGFAKHGLQNLSGFCAMITFVGAQLLHTVSAYRCDETVREVF